MRRARERALLKLEAWQRIAPRIDVARGPPACVPQSSPTMLRGWAPTFAAAAKPNAAHVPNPKSRSTAGHPDSTQRDASREMEAGWEEKIHGPLSAVGSRSVVHHGLFRIGHRG